MTAEYLKKVKSEVQVGGQEGKPTIRHEESQEKVFIVYKFIQTPIDAISAGM